MHANHHNIYIFERKSGKTLILFQGPNLDGPEDETHLCGNRINRAPKHMNFLFKANIFYTRHETVLKLTQALQKHVIYLKNKTRMADIS